MDMTKNVYGPKKHFFEMKQMKFWQDVDTGGSFVLIYVGKMKTPLKNDKYF